MPDEVEDGHDYDGGGVRTSDQAAPAQGPRAKAEQQQGFRALPPRPRPALRLAAALLCWGWHGRRAGENQQLAVELLKRPSGSALAALPTSKTASRAAGARPLAPGLLLHSPLKRPPAEPPRGGQPSLEAGHSGLGPRPAPSARLRPPRARQAHRRKRWNHCSGRKQPPASARRSSAPATAWRASGLRRGKQQPRRLRQKTRWRLRRAAEARAAAAAAEAAAQEEEAAQRAAQARAAAAPRGAAEPPALAQATRELLERLETGARAWGAEPPEPLLAAMAAAHAALEAAAEQAAPPNLGAELGSARGAGSWADDLGAEEQLRAEEGALLEELDQPQPQPLRRLCGYAGVRVGEVETAAETTLGRLGLELQQRKTQATEAGARGAAGAEAARPRKRMWQDCRPARRVRSRAVLWQCGSEQQLAQPGGAPVLAEFAPPPAAIVHSPRRHAAGGRREGAPQERGWALAEGCARLPGSLAGFLGEAVAAASERAQEVSTPASFVSVKAGAAEGSPLLLSREHLVFAASSADAPLAALPAAALAQGQWILRVDPLCGSFRRVQVSEVAEVSDKGWYAPLTQCGTVVVEGALCSCYADALPATLPGWFRRFATTHQAMHQAVLPLRLAALFAAAPQKGAEALEGRIHPYCRALMALPMAIA
ncbi:unnamed protein product [Prorocentrum cordatum]|uniref:Hedgehog protein Hint domain-containing protein n=1 Tax=Prorocentrum cordatum TaxID=2364126 RepID=A0ABN9UAE1_9DINO|nr:unnamed protein product [Polarella glacialis]